MEEMLKQIDELCSCTVKSSVIVSNIKVELSFALCSIIKLIRLRDRNEFFSIYSLGGDRTRSFDRFYSNKCVIEIYNSEFK